MANAGIYSATYSSVRILLSSSTLYHKIHLVFTAKTLTMVCSFKVPVFEFNVEGNHVMRRRSDDWINATHILKVANFDKPARTRILEREVQKGVHEKVQGGYGKYQGKSKSSNTMRSKADWL
jgi:KilA-N domain